MKPNFKKVSRIIKAISKNSSLILLITGGIGLVTAGAIAVNETPKAMKAIEDKKKELGKEKLTTGETVKAAWKCYIPSLTTLTISAGCLTGSYIITRKKLKSMEGACLASSAALASYKKNIDEILTPEQKEIVEKKVEEDTVKQAVENKKNGLWIPGKNKDLFVDSLTGQVFYANWDDICEAVVKVNNRIFGGAEPYVTVNEILEEYGAPDQNSVLGKTKGFTDKQKPFTVHRYLYKVDGEEFYKILYSEQPVNIM